MEEKYYVVIHDNKLSDSLKKELDSKIQYLKDLSQKDRYQHYGELNRLLAKVLDNKNKNYNEYLQNNKNNNIFGTIEIHTVRDSETERYIDAIFSILLGEERIK